MSGYESVAGYDPRAYEPVAVTVDVVAFTIRDGVLQVLLVERGEAPFLGRRALPGGFVRSGRDDGGRVVGESLDEAALRELAEETGLGTDDLAAFRSAERGAVAGAQAARLHLEQLGSYGAPDRDPRMRVVSVAYLAFAPSLPDPSAGGDASAAAWVPVEGATELAFDHDLILAEALERARAKLEYTPLAAAFVDEEFTIADLRAVYATVWGEDLHAGNFHRKVLSVPGFVESTGGTTERGGAKGGPRARLYRVGDARLLHPPLLRPTQEEAVR